MRSKRRQDRQAHWERGHSFRMSAIGCSGQETSSEKPYELKQLRTEHRGRKDEFICWLLSCLGQHSLHRPLVIPSSLILGCCICGMQYHAQGKHVSRLEPLLPPVHYPLQPSGPLGRPCCFSYLRSKVRLWGRKQKGGGKPVRSGFV